MTIKTIDSTDVRYFLVKEVDGVEVRRTELTPRARDATTGRFIAYDWNSVSYTTRRKVRCPRCGHKFEI